MEKTILEYRIFDAIQAGFGKVDLSSERNIEISKEQFSFLNSKGNY